MNGMIGRLYRDSVLKSKGVAEKINEKLYLGPLSSAMTLKKNGKDRKF